MHKIDHIELSCSIVQNKFKSSSQLIREPKTKDKINSHCPVLQTHFPVQTTAMPLFILMTDFDTVRNNVL